MPTWKFRETRGGAEGGGGEVGANRGSTVVSLECRMVEKDENGGEGTPLPTLSPSKSPKLKGGSGGEGRRNGLVLAFVSVY